MTNSEPLPLVYSCSGCSSAAQMANHLAIRMDRQGIAEMSCIAGVGGNVKSLVKKALSGREIIAIDGCPLACTKACLANHDVTPSIHIQLADFQVRKQQHADFDPQEAEAVLGRILDIVESPKTDELPCPSRLER